MRDVEPGEEYQYGPFLKKNLFFQKSQITKTVPNSKRHFVCFHASLNLGLFQSGPYHA
jgi:hypothetical protein